MVRITNVKIKARKMIENKMVVSSNLLLIMISWLSLFKWLTKKNCKRPIVSKKIILDEISL